MRIYFPVPDSAACAYCGDPATSWDHVRPIAWGGEDEPHNMVPACWPCNKAKRAQPAEVFRMSMAERREWLRSKGWLQTRDLPRDPDEPWMAIVCGRRINVSATGGAWWSPNTGEPHILKYALRKAAWGDDAEEVQLHERRRWW